MKRILIINVNWLGDVLFSTPLIRALRENNPDAYIACMVVPRCREILESNPRLNEIIIYDEDNLHKSIFGKLKLILYLRSRKFDTAVIIHRSFTRALIAFLAGITQRIGYRTKKRASLLNNIIEVPSHQMHRVDYFLNLGRALGVTVDKREYEFFISDADRRSVKNLLNKKGITEADTLMVLNPGGNWEPKRWAKENFAKLGDELIRQFNAKVVITGSKKDIALAQDIASIMKIKPVIVSGDTTLKELAALFERAGLVVANDSGPMHIAVSMKAKTIAIFGPTLPEITGPIGNGKYIVLQKRTNCEIPCYDLSCRDYRCMKAITPEDVITAAKRLI